MYIITIYKIFFYILLKYLNKLYFTMTKYFLFFASQSNLNLYR